MNEQMAHETEETSQPNKWKKKHDKPLLYISKQIGKIATYKQGNSVAPIINHNCSQKYRYILFSCSITITD